ncbi:MAG TPA: hypothetical protein VMA35_14405 [Candidatus Sulfopaludibacter sp.]|nr:hypothetical protein [Candidatus Sulfopaludibacter sp.]
MKTKTTVLAFVVCAGLLGITALRTQADTLITFQVDMSYQVQSGTFTNGVQAVHAKAFDPYLSGHPQIFDVQLTNNPSFANTNLYTGTYDDTVSTNGSQLQWKYYVPNFPNSGYETTANNNDNRAVLLPAGSGTQVLVLPVEWFNDAGPSAGVVVAANCTFQVDMAQQIQLGVFNPNTQTIEAIGQFGGWADGYTLTNDPTILRTNQFNLVTSNVYVGTFLNAGSTGSPGEVGEFKYRITGGLYESVSALNGIAQNNENRFCFALSNAQTLPIVYFSDAPYAPIATNTFTFSVDMSVQTWNGSLAAGQQVYLQGNFNNWTSQLCTNNPSAANTNIYYATAVITNGYGTTTQFKFLNGAGNYENNPSHTYAGNPSVLGGNQNREFIMPSATANSYVLPTVYYSDISTNSVLPLPTMVTFTVNMTNAVGTDSSVFNPSVDSVYLNGLDITNSLGNYSFDPWTNSLIVAGASGYTNALSNFQMQNNPLGSEIYTITVPVPSGAIPAGYPLQLSYQYTFGNNSGLPIEALGGTNHVRYIRSTGNYHVPQDTFGSMVQEQMFGNLVAGPKSGNNVPITWLGVPGVELQVSTNLTAGTWLTLPGTYGQSSTNYPAGTGASYFRLINPF